MVDWLFVRPIAPLADMIFFCSGAILACSFAMSWFSFDISSCFFNKVFLYVSS